jgi:hypothetical protein
MKRLIFLPLLLLWISFKLSAQSNKPSLFINCSKECYQDFLRTELSYFDFVRDRFEADIQILIIEQEQSNGGKQFTLQFKGTNDWQKINDTLIINIKQAATPDDVRVKIAQSISLFLMRIVPIKYIPDNAIVQFPKREINQIDSIKDKWNFWVFAPGVEGWAEGGTSNRWAGLKSDITIRRINSKSKFIAKPYYNYFSSFIKLDSTRLTGQAIDYGINLLHAKSINQHWSAGAILQYGYNSFLNISNTIKAAPVIEYNIFPFSINTNKQVRVAYQLGVNSFSYFDTTIYNKLNEVRPYHRITLNIEYNRPWGSIMAGVYHNAYLDNYNQNRTGFNALFALRLFEGFALTFEGQGFYMNDQISLLKNSLSDEAYYLGSQQLPANFNYEINFGIRFTFGSIYNNIVNPRFNNIE